MANNFRGKYEQRKIIKRKRFFSNTRPPMRLGRQEKKVLGKVLNITIVSWNVERKGTPAEIDSSLAATATRVPDVVCLQDAQLTSEGTDHFEWLCSGENGSAILINKKSNLQGGAFQRVNDRICVAEVTGTYGIKCNIVSCDIPPATDYQCEDMWAALTELMKTLPSNIMTILAGSFNAQMGKLDHAKEHGAVCGSMLLHNETNENGVKLKELGRAAHLRVVNTFGPYANKTSDYCTYKDGSVKSQTDYIIITKGRQGFTKEVFTSWRSGHKHALLGSGFTISELDRDAEEAETVDKFIQHKLVVSTWNIQGAVPARVDKMLHEHHLPIVCLQELFLTSDEDLQTENYTWLSPQLPWTKTVAIVVRTSPDIVVSNFQPVSEYLCAADIVFHGNTPIKVISCWVPLPADPKHTQVTEQLTEFVKAIPDDVRFVLCGEFSGKPETKESSEDTEQVTHNEVYLRKLADVASLTLESCLWHQLKKWKNGQHILKPARRFYSRSYSRWVPFFENNITCLFVRTNVVSDFDYIRGESVARRLISGEGDSGKTMDSKIVNGVIHKIRAFEYFDAKSLNAGDVESSETVCSVSKEDQEKFKDTPPEDEDLRRILGDFVVFGAPPTKNGPNKTSQLYIIVSSFREAKLGHIVIEEVDVMNEAGDRSESKIYRIKWQGITLAEYKGDAHTHITHMKKMVVNTLLAKLSELYYTIKLKKSFFNKGVMPVLADKPELKDIFVRVDTTKYATLEDKLKYIDEFFAEDTEAELVFTLDSTLGDFIKIKDHAKKNKLGYRFFMSSPKDGKMTMLSVFRRPQSLQLRDKLLSNDNHPKYYLVPPCGAGENYTQFCLKFETENMKEENKLYVDFWDTFNRTQNQKSNNTQPPPKTTAKVQEPRNQLQRQNHQGLPANRKRRLNPENSAPVRQRQQPTVGKKRKLDMDNSVRPSQRYQERGGRRNSEPTRFRLSELSYSSPNESREFTGKSVEKRARMNPMLPPVRQPRWVDVAPLIILWPITLSSQLEERPGPILEANFPTEIIQGGRENNLFAVLVTLPMRDRSEREYCLAIGSGARRAAHAALEMLIKQSTIIKPNPNFLCNGAAPNFVRYKVPCQTYPRTYIILTKYDTGPITEDSITELFNTFQNSFNEDVFFDKDGYTSNEKQAIIDWAPKYSLNVRHFGDSPGISNRYVCVYKNKSKHEVLEEVLKMRGSHPKYILTKDKLPPRLGMNIY